MNTDVPEYVALLMSAADFAGTASEESILRAERQFGSKFPDEYRAFLRRYGAALFPGFEVYGLPESDNSAEDPPLWSDIRVLLGSSAFKKIPTGLLPISDNGGDYKFYLQCREPEVGSVLVFGPGRDGVIVSRNFYEFIERAANQGLDSMI